MRIVLHLSLFTAYVLGNSRAEDHAVVQDFISSLQDNVKIDWNNPPTAYDHSIAEPTCLSWVTTCNPTYFSIKKSLVQNRPKSTQDAETVESEPQIEVYFIPRLERGVMNTGDDDIGLFVEESTSTIDSTTKGWQIGAQIFGGVTTQAGATGIAISGGYAKSWSTGTSQSKEISIQTTCRSGYDCRIETWTFHIKVSGHCQHKPVINCAGEMDPCAPGWKQTCSQFEAYRNKHCYTCNASSPYLHEPYEVHTPVLDQVGKPFVRLVRISEKIRWHASKDNSIKVQTAPKAIREDDGWYEVDNGEWYDPKDNSFYGQKGDKWYFKPDSPKPDLSKFTPGDESTAVAPAKVAVGDCRLSSCYRELLQVYGSVDRLRHQCHVHKKRPRMPLKADLSVFPSQPGCGKVTKSIKLRPKDIRSICDCLVEKEQTGTSCPDCKLRPCYRELHHVFESARGILQQCFVGGLRQGQAFETDISSLPFQSTCGKVSGFATFQSTHMNTACECVEHTYGIYSGRAGDRHQGKRSLGRPSSRLSQLSGYKDMFLGRIGVRLDEAAQDDAPVRSVSKRWAAGGGRK